MIKMLSVLILLTTVNQISATGKDYLEFSTSKVAKVNDDSVTEAVRKEAFYFWPRRRVIILLFRTPTWYPGSNLGGGLGTGRFT